MWFAFLPTQGSLRREEGGRDCWPLESEREKYLGLFLRRLPTSSSQLCLADFSNACATTNGWTTGCEALAREEVL